MTDKEVDAEYWKVDTFVLTKLGAGVESVKIKYTMVGYATKVVKESSMLPMQILDFKTLGNHEDSQLIQYPMLSLDCNKGHLTCNFVGYNTDELSEHSVPIH